MSPGKIVWANVEVPAGRTTGSSQKQYEGLLKAAALVPMTSGDGITPIKKRATGGVKKTLSLNDGGDGSPASTPKKRGRKAKKPETSEATVPAEADEEEEPESPKAKKVKIEKEEDLIGEEFANEAEAGFDGV